MILLGHLLGPEFIDSNISLLMGMTREGSIYEACGTFCRLLWVAINRGVVPGAGIEPDPKLLFILNNNPSFLIARPTFRACREALNSWLAVNRYE